MRRLGSIFFVAASLLVRLAAAETKSLRGLSDEQLVTWMGHELAERERELAVEKVPYCVLPAEIWTLPPREAARALVVANTPNAYRAAWQASFTAPDKTSPPVSGTLSGRLGYLSSDYLLLRVEGEACLLAMASPAENGTVHFRTTAVDPAKARQALAIAWWLRWLEVTVDPQKVPKDAERPGRGFTTHMPFVHVALANAEGTGGVERSGRASLLGPLAQTWAPKSDEPGDGSVRDFTAILSWELLRQWFPETLPEVPAERTPGRRWAAESKGELERLMPRLNPAWGIPAYDFLWLTASASAQIPLPEFETTVRRWAAGIPRPKPARKGFDEANQRNESLISLRDSLASSLKLHEARDSPERLAAVVRDQRRDWSHAFHLLRTTAPERAVQALAERFAAVKDQRDWGFILYDARRELTPPELHSMLRQVLANRDAPAAARGSAELELADGRGGLPIDFPALRRLAVDRAQNKQVRRNALDALAPRDHPGLDPSAETDAALKEIVRRGLSATEDEELLLTAITALVARGDRSEAIWKLLEKDLTKARSPQAYFDPSRHLVLAGQFSRGAEPGIRQRIVKLSRQQLAQSNANSSALADAAWAGEMRELMPELAKRGAADVAAYHESTNEPLRVLALWQEPDPVTRAKLLLSWRTSDDAATNWKVAEDLRALRAELAPEQIIEVRRFISWWSAWLKRAGYLNAGPTGEMIFAAEAP